MIIIYLLYIKQEWGKTSRGNSLVCLPHIENVVTALVATKGKYNSKNKTLISIFESKS